MSGMTWAVSQNASSPYAALHVLQGPWAPWISGFLQSWELGTARHAQPHAAGPGGEVVTTYFHILALNCVFPEHMLC